MNLAERVAVITGATGDLGRVLARRLSEQGARLALFSSSEARLADLVRELDLPAERTLSGAYSLQAHDAAQSAARAVRDRFGRADILVHLVGGWTGGKPVVEVHSNEVSAMLEQHLWTTFYLAQAFIPLMRANRWGRILAVSSPHVANPLAQAAPYAMAKAAQEALLLTMAQELKGTGITSNILLVRAIDAQHERDRNPTPHNAGWTTPEEISAAVFFLCSEAAHVVNGARIPLFEQ